MTSAAGLGLLGLGLKAGTVVVGTTGVRAALRRGDLALIIYASDRSDRTDEKVGRLARGVGVPAVVGPPARDLGRQLGRELIQVVGVRDARLAEGLRNHWAPERTQKEEQDDA